VLCGTIFSL